MKSLKRIDFDCSSSRVVVQGLGSIIHNLIYKGHKIISYTVSSQRWKRLFFNMTPSSSFLRKHSFSKLILLLYDS